MTGTRVQRNTTKRKRIPVSGRKDILTVEGKDKNYVYRWVNDVENRIQQFLDAGYIFVDPDGKLLGDDSQDNSSTPRESVASKYVGKGVTAFLMAQRKEWYEEDQKSQEERLQSIERSLGKSGQDGRYGEIKISRL